MANKPVFVAAMFQLIHEALPCAPPGRLCEAWCAQSRADVQQKAAAAADPTQLSIALQMVLQLEGVEYRLR
jgi:hypothetical protein